MSTYILLMVSMAWAVCAGRPFAQAAATGADASPPEVALQRYDPAGLVRFATKEQAEAKRQELIRFIWPQSLPTKVLPDLVKNVGREVFEGDLSGLNAALAASVDRLDANVAPYDFHGTSYLVHPSAQTANTRRLVIVNSGHRAGVAFTYGVNDASNRLLSEGFSILMTDMPLVGFNTHNTITLPDGKGNVTITQRGTAGHNEMFEKLIPGGMAGGAVFRLFLEPIVQGLNYFLSTTPDAGDVSYVGLSGGGWTGHMLAATDTRIKQSFPVAGALPLYAREFSPGSRGDTEQFYAPLYGETDTNGDGIADTASGLASWLEIFALGGFGTGRRQIQILNLFDSCCFNGPVFLTYTDFVASVVRKLGPGEWSFHSDTTHREHRISGDVLDRVIMPALTGKPPASCDSGPRPAGAAALPPEIEPVRAPFEMPQPKRPVFPDRVVSIREHGAVPDGKTLCTAAIARAIEACAKAGGGRVLVPAGTWLTGAIHLRSNIELHLEKDAVLRFSTDPKDYLPVVFTRWAGFECYNYSPLVYARDCENIGITGHGKLDGQGRSWWEWVKRQDEMAELLLDYGRRDVPVAERVFGNPEKPLRPQFISPINCRNVLIEGVSLNAGPFWTIQCVYCENVIVRGVTVENAGPPKGPNNDGINLDSCRNALVEYCTLDTGDDCICLKSGLNEDGWRVGRPTENVVIRHCLTKRGHGGAVIGSDMSGGVRRVLVHDCVFDGTLYGIRLKSARGRGGVVEDVWVRGVAMRNILQSAILMNTFYKAWAVTDDGKPPLFRNIRVEDVACEGARAAVEITGLPEQPIENLTFQRVSISAKTGLRASDVRGLVLSNVNIKAASGPPFQMKNCRDVVQ